MTPSPSTPSGPTLRDLLQPALAGGAALCLALLQELPVRAEPPSVAGAGAQKGAKAERRPSAERVCRTLTQAAADNGIPVDLFTRLIWQESRFNPDAVSPKGAMGIAQFMPLTASARGLADPFEPLTALRESASYLSELRTTFRGNLGLATAAYNAGPGRVEAWLDGRRGLPAETRAYVLSVTGHTADAWASQQPPQWQVSERTGEVDCTQLKTLIAASLRARPVLRASAAWGPWGVQLTANWSEGRALATYERLRRSYGDVLRDRLPLVLRGRLPGRRAAVRYNIRVSEKSRLAANALCARLRTAGGACVVLRNPTR